MPLTVGEKPLSVESAMRVAEKGEQVRVTSSSLRRMERFREQLQKKLERGEVIYGVNTGFGSLSSKSVNPGDLKGLQLNLVRSHAAGVGDPMKTEVVRAAMLIKLNRLLTGNSAARPEVAIMLAELLNKGVTPYVPSYGSLGASGDLVPSAHVGLTMVGEGDAYVEGEKVTSKAALSQANMRPLELKAKEGLSIVNGTQFTAALGCLAVHRGAVLLEAADSSVALTAEVLGACSQSFAEELMSMKAHPGQAYVARMIRDRVRGSARLRSDPTPQDPYSIRCAPQVHGAVKDALDFSMSVTEREMNSVSDNPVLLQDGTILHGGNFHAQHVAMVLDLLSLSLSYLGVISLARTSLLLSRTPPEKRYMARKPGLESGLMILEYTATALAAENAKQIHPESAYPANVSGGVEDHASHGVNAGLKALSVAQNVSAMLAIEMVCSSNVLGSGPQGVSKGSARLCRMVRSASPLLNGDRPMGAEVEEVSRLILAGKLG
jgi:histidine ammonia-lyase